MIFVRRHHLFTPYFFLSMMIGFGYLSLVLPYFFDSTRQPTVLTTLTLFFLLSYVSDCFLYFYFRKNDHLPRLSQQLFTTVWRLSLVVVLLAGV